MYKLQVVRTEKPPKPPKAPKPLKVGKPDKIRKPRKKWSRKMKLLVTAAVLATLIGGGYYYAHKTLTGPATGVVISTVPNYEKKKQIELEQFDGKLYSFAHPMYFVEQPQKGQQNNLEAHTFVGSQMVTQVLVTTVTSLPSKNPEDDPSYLVRFQDKTKYKMRQMVIKNEKVTIFTADDSQQLQQAAFWVHGDKLLTFVQSGAAANPQETIKQYNDMIASISWL